MGILFIKNKASLLTLSAKCDLTKLNDFLTHLCAAHDKL